MTREQALHQAIQNDPKLNFLRESLKCHFEKLIMKYTITEQMVTGHFDPTVANYERLIQQRIDVLTRHYLL